VNCETVKNSAVFLGLVVLAFASRLAFDQPNFHAVTATAMFAGFYFRNRSVAVCVPLVAMTASDWVIGGYTKEVMVAVYASFLLPIGFRALLRRRLSVAHVGACAVTSSLLFYLVTNAAVWHASNWYPHTQEGLLRCYAAALPFFSNALAGDAIFSGLLFGVYAFAAHYSAAAYGRRAVIVGA
jgi:uncharacterized protein DUF6580